MVFPASCSWKIKAGMLFAGALELDCPHGCINAALPVGDPEESVLPPTGVPTVFANPVAPRVVIANTANAMAAFQRSGDMVVNATTIALKIRIHTHASNQRAVVREPLFHARRCDYALPR